MKKYKGDLLINITLDELKRMIQKYYSSNSEILLKGELSIDTDPSGSKLLVDKDAQRLFLNPCRRSIPNGIVTPVVSTEYYATGGESVTMVQRFLDNDDIEQILRYYEAQGVKGRNSRKRLVLHRQKEFEITWDNSKPESHPYYEKKDL